MSPMVNLSWRNWYLRYVRRNQIDTVEEMARQNPEDDYMEQRLIADERRESEGLNPDGRGPVPDI